MSELAASYRELFGGGVEEHRGRVFLSMGQGLVGVALFPFLARVVVQRLAGIDASGPVIEVRNGWHRWVVLADPNGLVLSPADWPAGVEVLECPRRVLLPSGSASARWVIRPDARHRWLPTLGAVLAAVRAVT
ncbi:MAG: hypothetical protein ACRDQ7_24900 [Haloechinothrix sp.]